MLFVGLLLNPAGDAYAQSYRLAITPDDAQGRNASSSRSSPEHDPVRPSARVG